MNAQDLLRQQIDLANTAHQREVKDLQAAGLNPILSANSAGAAVPNLGSFAVDSGGRAGGTSGRTAVKLAKLNPTNKALDTANHAVSEIASVAKKIGYAEFIRQEHPDRINSAKARAEENQHDLVTEFARNNSNNQNVSVNETTSNTNSARSFKDIVLNTLIPGRSAFYYSRNNPKEFNNVLDVISLLDPRAANIIRKTFKVLPKN